MSAPIVSKAIIRNIEAELSLLGAALLEPAIVVDCAKEARAEDFGHELHMEAWGAMLRLVERGVPVDITTVDAEMREKLGDASNTEFLSNVLSAVPSAANAMHYARLVREAGERTRTRLFAVELYKAAAVSPREELSAAMETRALEVRASLSTGRKTRGGIKTAKEVARAALTLADARFDKTRQAEWKEYAERRKTGFSGLDEYLRFLRPGKHYIMAALPSAGKTSWMLRAATNIASKKTNVGVFSTEMDGDQLYAKGTGQKFRFSSLGFQEGELPDSGIANIVPAAKWWAGLGLVVDDDQDHTIHTLCASAKKMVEDHGVEIIFVDYVQNVKHTGAHPNTEQEIRAVVNGLTRFANSNKDRGVTVFSMAQLKSDVDGAKGSPGLRAVKGSSAFEEDADGLMYLMRETDPEAPREDQCRATIVLRKHREGSTGMAQLRFIPEYADFEDYKQHDSNPF